VAWWCPHENYDITPVSKPRMTQRDRWHKRPATAAYWAFKAEVRLLGINMPESGYHITFVIPMPKSWSQKKRAQLNGKAHQPSRMRQPGKGPMDALSRMMLASGIAA
jgi:hypothetical protein